MTKPATNAPARPARQWYCLRTQPKHEHIAAAHLKRDLEIEVYLPRIRFRRATRQGAAWCTEALFPNYLFACFELASALRRVHHARGVRGVVHFGRQWPAIPGVVIEELRAVVGADEVHVIRENPQPGETVRIAGGILHGLEGLVTRLIPARQRVALLLEFLGRQTAVELEGDAVVREDERRRLA